MMCSARAAVLLVFALFTTVGAWADGPTKYAYVDADGISRDHEATVLTSSSNQTPLAPGWYVATGDVTYTGQLQFSSGDVHLILCPDVTLTITSGNTNALEVNGNLTIYCQTATGNQQNIGALVATSGGLHSSGIHANNNGNITINGGQITATSSTGYAISTTGIITINSGNVTATTSASSEKSGGLRAHAINLSWYSETEDQITATSYLVERNSTSFSNIPSVVTLNKPFKDKANGNNIYSSILTDAQRSEIAGKTLIPFPCVFLYNDEYNDIASINYEPKNVCLQGRTLFKDGAWNTLCLPFSLNSLDGTPLAGATLMELAETNPENGTMHTGFDPSSRTLYLYFKSATSIKAGKPYIIKWNDDGSNNIVSPLFTNVTVTTAPASGVSNEKNEYIVRVKKDNLNAVEFRGSYSPVSLPINDMSVYFLGTSINNNQLVSTLYYPNAANNSDGKYYVNSCRAYFWVDLTGAANVSAFVLNIDSSEEETTSIIDNGQLTIDNEAGAWYSLDGRKLNSKPTQKGMYIHNGKKFVMK